MGDNLEAISLPTDWTLHSLSAGYYHTCALVSEVGSVDGVVCWGANFNGQVCVGGCTRVHAVVVRALTLRCRDGAIAAPGYLVNEPEAGRHPFAFGGFRVLVAFLLLLWRAGLCLWHY